MARLKLSHLQILTGGKFVCAFVNWKEASESIICVMENIYTDMHVTAMVSEGTYPNGNG